MIQEIKNLRVSIDGLAQLTKGLSKPYGIAININHIPGNWTPDSWIKYFRETNNAFIQSEDISKSITTFDSRPTEMDKCYDSLILAKAWLGKILGELGTESPYPKDGTRKTVEDIEPTADTHGELSWDYTAESADHPNDNPWTKWNHIEKVDWLRQEIQKLIQETSDFSQEEPSIELEQGFVYKYLCEARFWLGFELQRIKENESSK